MTPDPTTDYAARPEDELRRALRALRLEVPAAVADDVEEKVMARVASLEAELAEAREKMEAAYDAAGDKAALAEYEYERAERAKAALRDAADAIQEKKHSAGMSTAQCARDAEWDLEAYWRARGEGLAQAEAIVRAALAASPSSGETCHPSPGDELPGAQAGTALQVPDTKIESSDHPAPGLPSTQKEKP